METKWQKYCVHVLAQNFELHDRMATDAIMQEMHKQNASIMAIRLLQDNVVMDSESMKMHMLEQLQNMKE